MGFYPEKFIAKYLVYFNSHFRIIFLMMHFLLKRQIPSNEKNRIIFVAEQVTLSLLRERKVRTPKGSITVNSRHSWEDPRSGPVQQKASTVRL